MAVDLQSVVGLGPNLCNCRAVPGHLPVCGMFVSLYPDWVATVVYQDGRPPLRRCQDLFQAPAEPAEIRAGSHPERHRPYRRDRVLRSEPNRCPHRLVRDRFRHARTDGPELVPLGTEEESQRFPARSSGPADRPFRRCHAACCWSNSTRKVRLRCLDRIHRNRLSKNPHPSLSHRERGG